MPTVTKTKEITFAQVMKMFKKFVAKSSSRPVLQYVYFDGSHFVATNSHVLLRVNKDYITDIPEDLPKTFLYDPKEMISRDIDMKYPDVSKLIMNYSDSMVTMNDGVIKEFINQIKEAKKVVNKKKNKPIGLSFCKPHTIIESEYEEINYKIKNKNIGVDGNEITLHLNAQYLVNALEVVKKFNKVSNDNTEIRMYSPLRPIQITKRDVFDIVLMPVRLTN